MERQGSWPSYPWVGIEGIEGIDSCCHHRNMGPRSALSLKVDAVRAGIWVLLHLEIVHAQPEVPEQGIP